MGTWLGNEEDGEEPPEGCHHYTSAEELDDDLQKYFHQRHRIFSLYDEGIWMTEDAWFGVTPEPVANQIATYLRQVCPADTILVDAFAGVGGNAIAFALTGHFQSIYAIEKDPETLACARHNARIYGVEEAITWIQGDCFTVMVEELYDQRSNLVIFASPPWGGPGYQSDQVFDLSQMQPYNLDEMMRAFRKMTERIILYLPRTADVRQLAVWQTLEVKLALTHYCMRGASKALCAYFGDLSADPRTEAETTDE